MNILLLSSNDLRMPVGKQLEAALWRDGARVWLDWPIHRDHYVDQMLSMMNEADLVVFLLDRHFVESATFPSEWEAATTSTTQKLVVQTDATAPKTDNPSFSFGTCNVSSEIVGIVSQFVAHGFKLSLFVSYAHKDNVHANAFVRLAKHSRSPVWIDRSGLKPGKPFRESLVAAIESTNRFVLLWSANARVSPWVEEEWRHAINNGKVIAPVLLDATPLPKELSSLHAFQTLHDGLLLDWLSIPDKTRQSLLFRISRWLSAGL